MIVITLELLWGSFPFSVAIVLVGKPVSSTMIFTQKHSIVVSLQVLVQNVRNAKKNFSRVKYIQKVKEKN